MRGTAVEVWVWATLLLGTAAVAGANQILVAAAGGDYPTIQQGLDAAAAGDTVVVAPGLYSGALNRDLDFQGKDVVLVSSAGAAATVIDCGLQSRAFSFSHGETRAAVVRGFTVRSGRADAGGGIDCRGGASPVIDGCVITECEASMGGGVNCDGQASPHITGCIIASNSADVGGGGIRCTGASTPMIEDCILRYNSAEYGGGMISKGWSHPKLDGVVFEYNTAEYSGGMRFEEGPATLTGVTFRWNHAWFSGGAMGSGSGGEPRVSHSAIIGNQADTRGGGYSNGTEAQLSNCTFAGNGAPNGGALFCGPGGRVVLTDSILAFSTQGGAVSCEGAGATPEIAYSCVFGNVGGNALCGTHYDNLFEDPLFCNYGAWDLTLDAESPCLPVNNPWNVLMGAYDKGCGGPATARPATWTSIKAMYR